jgi:nucleotide-binding universal stress UspA family protein
VRRWSRSFGSAHQEIARAARSTRAHLIIIATKGRTGLKRALLGSKVEAVVRRAVSPDRRQSIGFWGPFAHDGGRT